METEIEVTHSQAKDSQGPQKLKEASQDFLPNTAKGVKSCYHLDFELLAFRTVKEYSSVVSP